MQISEKMPPKIAASIAFPFTFSLAPCRISQIILLKQFLWRLHITFLWNQRNTFFHFHPPWQLSRIWLHRPLLCFLEKNFFSLQKWLHTTLMFLASLANFFSVSLAGSSSLFHLLNFEAPRILVLSLLLFSLCIPSPSNLIHGYVPKCTYTEMAKDLYLQLRHSSKLWILSQTAIWEIHFHVSGARLIKQAFVKNTLFSPFPSSSIHTHDYTVLF